MYAQTMDINYVYFLFYSFLSFIGPRPYYEPERWIGTKKKRAYIEIAAAAAAAVFFLTPCINLNNE